MKRFDWFILCIFAIFFGAVGIISGFFCGRIAVDNISTANFDILCAALFSIAAGLLSFFAGLIGLYVTFKDVMDTEV